MQRVAIVIVTWNSAAEIGGCLDALRTLPGVEVVVVDNASSDTTREVVARYPARLIANPNNAGFAAAVNQGIRATTAPLILLLNPDAHLLSGLDALIFHFDDAKTGAAGGLLVGPDGKPQAGFMARNLPTATTLVFEVLGLNRIWPGNPVNWHYRCRDKDPMTLALVDQPAGAFLMFSRDVWQAVGGFDERFWPVWFEDADFCAAIKSLGYSVYYNPNAVARHTGSHSVGTLSLEKRERYWYGSLLKYAAKHYRPGPYRAVCLAVVIGVSLRAVRVIPREGRKAFAVYGDIAGLALRSLFGSKARFRGTVA